ncbi:hypothetical protein T05_12646 [Trichinella murrelli]|uniref:Uncharacterized protein n=1 Tax=Trichinella murrelli TaxID=144512 RepID=A0A0V0TYK1_9BILA|nr:hypothetical protein T05_12646 [Trichinella murrelli]
MNIFSFQVTKKSNFVLNTCHYKIIHPIDAENLFYFVHAKFRKAANELVGLYSTFGHKKQNSNKQIQTSPDYQLQYR